MSPARKLRHGPLAGVMFGAAWGSAFSGLLGAISGASDPDKALRKIEGELRAGKVLVAVETDDDALEQVCDRVFAAHGGQRVE